MRRLGVVLASGSAVLLLAIGISSARAQIPELPGLPIPAAPEDGEPKAKAGERAAPTEDNPEATIAEAPGKIDVENRLDEERVKEFLETTLNRYPGVYEVHAEVDDNVVTLTGHVEDADIRDRLREVTLKVEGVVFVINQIRTDAQVLTAFQMLSKRLGNYAAAIGQNWLLFVLALGIILASLPLARLVLGYGDTMLRPFTSNALLRSVLVSVLAAATVIGGIFAGLQVFGLAEAVLTAMGLTAVLAVALGFAFRDIAENFIASLLLGLRRPFRVGDYVEVAGKAGVVKSLNTRATVLVTLEGKHVRIPNATVFKEITVNATASASGRGTFDVLIPYEVSTAKALEAIDGALRQHDGLLPDPAPRTLVEELTPAGVKLRAYFWFPTQGVDGFKILSDARLKAKVALQSAGISPPPAGVTLSVAGPVPVDLVGDGASREGRLRGEDGTPVRPGPVISADQARANLRRDARAAEKSDQAPAQQDAKRRVLDAAGRGTSDEGENLLAANHAGRDEGDDGL